MTRQRPGDWLSATASVRRLGVSTRVLRRYTQDGKLPDVRGGGGRRIFRAGDLDALTGKGTAGQAVGYARVSSRRQHPDRLARFGTGLVEHLPAGLGVTVTCTGRGEDETWERELVRGMLAIVTSFAGRLYGQRSAKARRLHAVVAAETRGEAA